MTICGYEFRDASLAETALTTPSFRMSCPSARDNQRLEYLGDAVLGLLAADWLYAANPGAPEGELTARRQHMVSSAALCEAAVRCGLPAMLRRNKGAEPLPAMSKTVADAAEAVFGAAWLDGGLDAARKVFDALGLADFAQYGELDGNPKAALQHASQAMRPPRAPEYKLVRRDGTPDRPVFTAEVSVAGVGTASATGGSRKEAEARAAALLLQSFDRPPA